MKKLSIILGCLMLIIFMVGCGTKKTDTTDTADTIDTDNKIAVVYFSATGNTKEIAERIAEEAGADLFEIIPKQEYTEKDLNYNHDDCRANREQKDESARPEISNDLAATQEYDVVFLGHPIWWGTVPRIIRTYLEQYDMSGAAIHTFCTSGGSGIGASISDLREWYPSLNIADGERLNDAAGSDIEKFVRNSLG